MLTVKNRWTIAAAWVVIALVLAACQPQAVLPTSTGSYTPPSAPTIQPGAAQQLPPQNPTHESAQQAGGPPPTIEPPQPPQGGQVQQGQPPQGGQTQGLQQTSGGIQGQPGGQQTGGQPGGQQGSSFANNPTAVSGLSSGAQIDLHNLTLGTLITTSPQRGGLWSCATSFTGGGASGNGPWIHADGTYDLLAKATVDGSVSWPHEFTVLIESSARQLTGNDLPDHVTGNYPISQSDDAYQYDRNPNSVSAQNVSLQLAATPQLAASISCVGGQVGILLSGSYLFNAVDAAGHDAVAYEIQDQCGGHPQQAGAYHYHGYSPCIDDTHAHVLIGYALDGFGIYGPYDSNGTYLSNADLDECHGHLHEIEWDGQIVQMYHYHANHEFPYTVGCFRGTAIPVQGGQGGQQGGGQPGGQTGGQQGGPPPGGGQAGSPPPPPTGGGQGGPPPPPQP